MRLVDLFAGINVTIVQIRGPGQPGLDAGVFRRWLPFQPWLLGGTVSGFLVLCLLGFLLIKVFFQGWNLSESLLGRILSLSDGKFMWINSLLHCCHSALQVGVSWWVFAWGLWIFGRLRSEDAVEEMHNGKELLYLSWSKASFTDFRWERFASPHPAQRDDSSKKVSWIWYVVIEVVW